MSKIQKLKALHFGAGNIGLGFIGQLLIKSNFVVYFADIDENILKILSLEKKYLVNELGKRLITKEIRGINVVHSNDIKVISLIGEVDLITTSVGVNVLKDISLIIAKGLILRSNKKNFHPLNIISCENLIYATNYLYQQIIKYIPTKLHNFIHDYIGFINSSVDRIVPLKTTKEDKKLSVNVESFYEWVVDKNQFKGLIPNIHGVKFKNNLIYYIERKIFTLNTGHAITAYLGNIYGYQKIIEAISDDRIYKIVLGAMQETGEFLIKKYNLKPESHYLYINKTISRFKNIYINDSIVRVARNPIQKLKFNERFIRPLLGTLKYNLSNSNLLIGIASVLHYRHPKDIESNRLHNFIQKEGIYKTLVNFCGLDNNHKKILFCILNSYFDLSKYYLKKIKLLSS
ncbi:mannitol-1-phosphate 5-dehydrogenase [Buchnera aphidicola (Neophyllaphis varicolor)]|uniref:mannitol-1-phosphate 5-dehydrogenase n=1 Tax=Buchnera aphidicola TaxID=9 RepID=UPI0031B89363